MLSLEWPLVLILAPLPLLIRWLLPRQDAAAGAIKVPFFHLVSQQTSNDNGASKTLIIKALLLWLIWLLTITALSRPMYQGDTIELPQDRRDLLLAVDISESMLEEDMRLNNSYVDRISAVKSVVGGFVEQRSGDRLGLILFGQQAYLQTPLTHDRQTVKQQLEEALVGFAGRATAIGDTIGLAIKRLRDRPAESRVLILLTDGANSAGSEPRAAADIAAEADIKIHTIGVGAITKVVADRFGRSREVRVRNRIDEPAMRYIASKTGGQYFRATDSESLKEIYQTLDQLEPKPETQTFRERKSLLHWPALFALLFALSLMMINRWWS